MEFEVACLAHDVDRFLWKHDPHSYGDAVEDSEESVQRITEDLTNGTAECLQSWLQDVIIHNTDSEDQLGYRFVRIGEADGDVQTRKNDYDIELYVKIDVPEWKELAEMEE